MLMNIMFVNTNFNNKDLILERKKIYGYLIFWLLLFKFTLLGDDSKD